jgi:hypothetical protein
LDAITQPRGPRKASGISAFATVFATAFASAVTGRADLCTSSRYRSASSLLICLTQFSTGCRRSHSSAHRAKPTPLTTGAEAVLLD